MTTKQYAITLKWRDIKRIQREIVAKKKQLRLAPEAVRAFDNLSSQLPMAVELPDVHVPDDRDCSVQFELSERHAKMLASLLWECRAISEPLNKSVVN